MASTLKAFWVILWTLSCNMNKQAELNLIPSGLNVCSRQESSAQIYVVSVQQSVNKQVSYKCRNQNFWLYKTCYRTEVAYQVGYKQVYKAIKRTVYVCCAGWKATGNSCTAPICSNGCHNGTCVKPDICTCLPGYHGAACDTLCTPNKWGSGCNNTCQCKNNATCDMRNGSCSCLPGWQGKTCDQPCKQSYHGIDCAQACACQNGATCNHVTGDCSCSAGWQGQQCNVTCIFGYYGDKCQQTCKCRHNTNCDHVTGACLCKPGYQGIFCEKPCTSGYYGNGCQEKCRCEHGSCNHVSGTCTCKTGYTGSRCTETCLSGTYGKNCSLSCSCSPTAHCNPIDGSCTCKTGFAGESCDQKCSSGYYGNQCQERCSCHSDESCDPVNGTCTCRHEGCNERYKSSKSKTSTSNSSPILPAVISVIAILVIIAIAIGCFIYHKRRKQRMRNKRENDEPAYEFQDENGANKLNEEHEFVAKDSLPIDYVELKSVSHDDGIQNPAYQGLKKSRASHVDPVTMETQYAVLSSSKKTESVYQPLQRESVKQGRGGLEEGNGSAQLLDEPGYDESPAQYENVASGSRTEDDNVNENLYLELLSNEYQPDNPAMSDQPIYEISPPTANDNGPIYDNF